MGCSFRTSSTVYEKFKAGSSVYEKKANGNTLAITITGLLSSILNLRFSGKLARADDVQNIGTLSELLSGASWITCTLFVIPCIKITVKLNDMVIKYLISFCLSYSFIYPMLTGTENHFKKSIISNLQDPLSLCRSSHYLGSDSVMDLCNYSMYSNDLGVVYSKVYARPITFICAISMISQAAQ